MSKLQCWMSQDLTLYSHAILAIGVRVKNIRPIQDQTYPHIRITRFEENDMAIISGLKSNATTSKILIQDTINNCRE